MTAMRVSPQLPRLNWTTSFDHLSARASSVSGTVRSSALAVLRLMTLILGRRLHGQIGQVRLLNAFALD
jgi:hypothetical protein